MNETRLSDQSTSTLPSLPIIHLYSIGEKPKTTCGPRCEQCSICTVFPQPCFDVFDHYVLVQEKKHIDLMKTKHLR